MSGQDDEVREVVDLTTTVVDFFPQKPQNLDDDVVYIATTKAPLVVSASSGASSGAARDDSGMLASDPTNLKVRFILCAVL